MRQKEFDALVKEAEGLLCQLALIPSPTGKEQKKAFFIKSWLEEQGADPVQIDEAGNVYWLWGNSSREMTVFMAHMDTVFSEETRLSLTEKDGRLYCPGIGDNTANLVCMLMAAKYAASLKKVPAVPILFAMTVGEEGLGNLKGSRKLFETFGERVQKVICFDLYREAITCQAVGSVRYEVKVTTQGGHSYNEFGKESAIAAAAELIRRLYQQKVPEKEKTTYNVGTINGGTTVNSIAAETVFTYEYRSLAEDCMKEMEEQFRAVMGSIPKERAKVSIRNLGVRPCSRGQDEKKLEALTQQYQEILQRHTECTVQRIPYSTDANIPLSMGIPSVNIGTISGGGLHSSGEYIEKDSIREGVAIALECLEAAGMEIFRKY